MKTSVININEVYRSALAFTLREKYGYKTPKNILSKFHQKNSSIKDVCKYFDNNFDLNNKTKKNFVKVLKDYLGVFNQLFRPIRT
tara:strand:+ start:351 stop:605 length:255 start_codon:yes stop_codon:yes gene_type:complete